MRLAKIQDGGGRHLEKQKYIITAVLLTNRVKI
jgi:hypothetical protein